MRKPVPRLPPIAVEERPEKLALAFPMELKTALEDFGRFFADASGQTPTSFNAVVVGILNDYLANHRGYQGWLKAHGREVRSAPSAAAS